MPDACSCQRTATDSNKNLVLGFRWGLIRWLIGRLTIGHNVKLTLAVSQLVSPSWVRGQSWQLGHRKSAVISCSRVPAAKDVNKEAEESPLLRDATKQWAREGTADWEDLVCTVVICTVCELVTAL
jgi:hypothetical protein